jgi:hypothetical protein
MNRIPRAFVLTALVVSPFCTDDARTQVAEEIVLGPEELRTAFYERAPRAFVSAMSKAVAASCSSDSIVPAANAGSWLCLGAKLTYFRSVYIDGRNGPHGLVCEDYDLPTFMYLGVDLVVDAVASGSCVRAEFDGSRYEVVGWVR